MPKKQYEDDPKHRVVFMLPDTFHKLRTPLYQEIGTIRMANHNSTEVYVEFDRDKPHHPVSQGWWVDVRSLANAK